MLSFIKGNKIDINSVLIPDFGWTKEKETESIIQWINPNQAMALSVNFFSTKPDIPTIKNFTVLRQFYRNSIIQHRGGLICVDPLEINGMAGVKTIFKIPQEPTGMTYLASCTIPFARYSYVIKIQAPELGITGFRDTAIFNRLTSNDSITSKEAGWFSDPYDSSFTEGTLMNKAEDVQYDEQFPDHPLTQARKLINEISLSLKFETEVYKVKRFKK